jgi:hypothetical protein
MNAMPNSSNVTNVRFRSEDGKVHRASEIARFRDISCAICAPMKPYVFVGDNPAHARGEWVADDEPLTCTGCRSVLGITVGNDEPTSAERIPGRCGKLVHDNCSRCGGFHPPIMSCHLGPCCVLDRASRGASTLLARCEQCGVPFIKESNDWVQISRMHQDRESVSRVPLCSRTCSIAWLTNEPETI